MNSTTTKLATSAHVRTKSAYLSDTEGKTRHDEVRKSLFERDKIALKKRTPIGNRSGSLNYDHSFRSNTKSTSKRSMEGSRYYENKTDKSTTTRYKSPPHNRADERKKYNIKHSCSYSKYRKTYAAQGKISTGIEESPRRQTTTSTEKVRRHSPCESPRRIHTNRRSQTPPTSSCSSQVHERTKHSTRNLYKSGNKVLKFPTTTSVSNTPQYIPIPVPVPAWPFPPHPWHPSAYRPPPPPPHFYPAATWPMVPPIRSPCYSPYFRMPTALPYRPMTAQYRPYAAQRIVRTKQNRRKP